jgi:aminoglycoside phosphotransferase (APT) family kinase protein
MREIPVLLERLAIAAPQLRGAVEPLRNPLHDLAVAHAAEPVVPTHGAFSPEQVLLDARGISFIDFDNFGLAEPALELAASPLRSWKPDQECHEQRAISGFAPRRAL